MPINPIMTVIYRFSISIIDVVIKLIRLTVKSQLYFFLINPQQKL